MSQATPADIAALTAVMASQIIGGFLGPASHSYATRAQRLWPGILFTTTRSRGSALVRAASCRSRRAGRRTDVTGAVPPGAASDCTERCFGWKVDLARDELREQRFAEGGEGVGFARTRLPWFTIGAAIAENARRTCVPTSAKPMSRATPGPDRRTGGAVREVRKALGCLGKGRCTPHDLPLGPPRGA